MPSDNPASSSFPYPRGKIYYVVIQDLKDRIKDKREGVY
jgi:hypothetical protein